MDTAEEVARRSARRAAERAADRMAHLDAGRSAAAVVAPSRRAVPALDPASPAVRAYRSALTGLRVADVEARLAVLAEFCAQEGETPDELVEAIFDRDAYRYVRRTHYTERILAFSAQWPGPEEEQRARGDVIRAFFLANGHRIPPARVPWQVWAQMP